MECPAIEIFEDYLHGELKITQRTDFEEHIGSCQSCRTVLERENRIDELFQLHTLQRAPAGFIARLTPKLTPVTSQRSLPDWLQALALGLIIVFAGFSLGKWATPFLKDVLLKLSKFGSDKDVLGSFKEIEIFSKSGGALEILSGNEIMALNLFIAGVIFCWGLWQMVKAFKG
ncbi:hypothetical protein CEE37_09600 [candidate division LCP-89 bacterium B3_LCP]|uniref:Zinc-finger domain-containing protein n=1 Tax=candidate division LCP-89 bacterium B3_LCP TaxID=2012998 RepID=A0A532UYG8_UNCL8|nr:MAG: hypothetical protein CEE37_09600 [candidate division LCP-89 bacterium B3_LCP]